MNQTIYFYFYLKYNLKKSNSLKVVKEPPVLSIIFKNVQSDVHLLFGVDPYQTHS
jgi:hypothetical protein